MKVVGGDGNFSALRATISRLCARGDCGTGAMRDEKFEWDDRKANAMSAIIV
jgi:hypothetical protein